MRYIKTFVLHLYVDPDAPERLCGDVRPVEAPQNYPFKNQTELEELLVRLIETLSIPRINSSGCGSQPGEEGIK